MSFHHGTETHRIDGGSSPVYTVNGAITAIVGTAPIGDVNVLTPCQTNKDFAKFGGDEVTRAGFTIPDTAHIWTRYKAGLAYVVNVCDPARHKTVVTNEVLTVDAGTLTAKTRKPAIQRGYTVKDGQTVLNANQYTINTLTGEITFNARPTAPTISYTYTDPTKVTEADILGGFVASSGKRTGLELLTEGFGKFAGTIKLPSGVEALEGEITWNSFYENVFGTIYHPFKAVQLMVRADIQKHDAQGLSKEVPFVTILTGTFSKNPLGSYKPKEKAEFASIFQAHEVRQLVDGKEVFYFNAFKNEYRVNGTDVLANFRRVVGA